MARSRDWHVVRTGLPAERGVAHTQGHLTHQQARRVALDWYWAGWDVRLERRDGKKVIKKLVPRFPWTKQGSW